ncbi:KRAB-A domain-containing protein 2-like [Homarus americanus]|uniref:KRAB-A domain-containing protein 2-like n=1 Tax=Homarus americanus TaxID=6706 RepID=A0A8J5JDM7_HOMAM|nr:KRAB-A domain-containing protein 2-like [Homarus americanus]
MDGRKERFDLVLAQAEKEKSYNASSLLPRREYESNVDRLMELEKPEVKRTQMDYRLLNKYAVMEISVEGTTVQKLIKKGTALQYVCAEALFDTIQTAHLANGHVGRNTLYKATSEKYANITIAQIRLYL